MTESWEDRNIDRILEDIEQTDLFGNGSSSEEEQPQPQTGLSGGDINPNLIDNTTPGGPPQQQWINPQSATLASGNPRPPPDQIAMDAVMANTPFPGHAPRTEWGSNASYASTGYGTNLQHGGGNYDQAPVGFGMNNQYGGGPPPPKDSPPDLPYGADASYPTGFGFRPPVNTRTPVGMHGPSQPIAGAPLQPSAGPPLQQAKNLIPDRFPTQHRYGLPGLDYLPPGYSWSNARCSNCDHFRKACSSFPKVLRKDLSQTIIKFPCDQCASDDSKAASCTWSITKITEGEKLYWNGAQVISDPVARADSTNRYTTYKKYRVVDVLVPSPYPPHTGPSNQPGVAQTSKDREVFRRHAILQLQQGAPVPLQGPVRPAAAPPRNQSGRIGKLPPKSAKKLKPYGNTKKKGTCVPCHDGGDYSTMYCDIDSNFPCRRCRDNPALDQDDCIKFHEEGEEDDSDSGLSSVSHRLGEELNRAIPPRRIGRIQNSLASGMSTRSKTSPNGKSPNGRKKSTRKGMAGSGGMQRPPSDGSRSPSVRGSQQPAPTAGSMLDNFDPGVFGDDLYREDEPIGNSCTHCRNNGLLCDGKQPCGNCVMEFCECAYLDQQAFPGPQSSPPVWERGMFGSTPRQGLSQNVSPGAATQALADLLSPPAGFGVAVPQQDELPENFSLDNVDDWMQGLLHDSPEQDREPEQDQEAGNSQHRTIFDELGLNPYQAVQNDQHHFPPAPEAAFQEVRDQNAAQQRYEANFPLDERAANALVQNHHVEGGAPLEVIEALVQPIGIHMHNVDDQAIRDRRDPSLPPLSGAVLPQVGVPQNRAYIGSEACEDIDACHESNGNNQRCGYRPTKPCSVYGHNLYCVCTSCKETQDFYANAGTPENPSQQEVIDATKGAYCGACAQVTKKELEQGDTSIRINSCLCTGQMSKAWMCSVHRVQAKMLVRRRTLLMRDWAARKLTRPWGKFLPCARCSSNISDVNSGVWECVACCERVVQARF